MEAKFTGINDTRETMLEKENAKLREEIERLRDCLCHERTRVAELIDRAEAAEAKLKALDKQIPVAYEVVDNHGDTILCYPTRAVNKTRPLYAKPVPPVDVQEFALINNLQAQSIKELSKELDSAERRIAELEAHQCQPTCVSHEGERIAELERKLEFSEAMIAGD